MPAQPRPTAARPVTGEELDEVVKLGHEWGQLKRLPRTGWLRAGIAHPESVADHSLRAAMLAWVLAALEGADAERAATLALFHDSGESRTTDVDHVGANYLHATSNERIAADQTAALPGFLAAMLRGLVAEYEARESAEAACARDADKLEMLLQALEYRQQGNANMDAFIRSALTALGTASGRRLGESAMAADPAAWWQGITRAVAPSQRPSSENGR
jgi:5'-deoxynucleotidase YfbR-like HD superfamily hydrolase